MTNRLLKSWSQPSAAPRKTAVLLSVGLAIAAVVIYWPVANHGFINFDDPDYVTMNPRTQAGLTLSGLGWAFTSYWSSNWHPVTWLSHMVDCQLYGLRPAGHHLTNLGLHLGNTLLLFFLLLRLTRAPWRSAFVAALFALHPLHVESVAWIAERKDVLSTFFGFLCLGAYARWVEESQNPAPISKSLDQPSRLMQHAIAKTAHPPGRSARAWSFYGLALVLFAFGLMSKPMLVTWPCVMLLLDYWPLERFQLAKLSAQLPTLGWLLLEKIPFFALSAASSAVTFLAQKSGGAVVNLEASSFQARLLNAVAAYGSYLSKTFWPAKLSPFYPYEHLEWLSWPVFWGLLILVVVTGLVLVQATAKPYLLVGWFWFLGTLVPVIGLLQVGQQAMADRYTYVPLIGIFLMITWTAADWCERTKVLPATRGLAAAVPLVACCILTSLQLHHWRDSKSLFQHAVAVTSNNYVAHAILGTVWVKEGQLAQAIDECRVALQISPRYPEAHNLLANALQTQGKYEEAVEECRIALRISPHHAETHYLLGTILEKEGKYDEAITCYRQALEANPLYLGPYEGVGSALLKKRAYAEAEAPCRQALTLAPQEIPAMYCLATSLHNQGKYDEAVQWYKRIIALNPSLFAPHRYLANALMAEDRAAEAVSEFMVALKLQPGDLDTRNSLGLALLQQGRSDEAMARFRETIEVQPTNFLANYQLALLHQSRKEMRDAIACFHRALEAGTNAPDVLNNLAWILAANPDPSVRNGVEAVTLAERACSLTGYRQPVLVGTLAAAYAEAERYSDAVRTAERARELAIAAGQSDLAETNRKLLELYRANKPYHEGLLRSK